MYSFLISAETQMLITIICLVSEPAEGFNAWIKALVLNSIYTGDIVGSVRG